MNLVVLQGGLQMKLSIVNHYLVNAIEAAHCFLPYDCVA